MAETANLALPLVAAAQAQKHVTVNEALVRIDALAQLRVERSASVVPPAEPVEGTCCLVPPGASGAWAGRAAQVAIWSNGGWDFAQPRLGWRAFDAETWQQMVFDGASWVPQGNAFGAGGSATLQRIIELDHEIGPGPSSMTAPIVPAGGQVLAVTLRVIEVVTGGGVTSLSLGVTQDNARYGSGIGLGLNAWGKGVTGAPVTYYSDTALLLTAVGGSFAGGKVRLAVHLTEVIPPRSV
jgi:hypothetical protein